MPMTAAPSTLGAPSPFRAWCYLVWLCWQRQARARQMVWIALALLGLTAIIVSLASLSGPWGSEQWPWRWQAPPDRPGTYGPDPRAAKDGTKLGPEFGATRVVVQTFGQAAVGVETLSRTLLQPPPALALEAGLAGAAQNLLKRSGFYVFSNWIVFSVFVGFLLPIWSLSFATDALGGERESRSLIWLLTRPLPRAAIYLAKFVAVLPWCLTLNLGGFGLLCVLAGPPGRQAFSLFWPAVLGGSLAFCSLFHLMGALFRRAAVVALVYAFFLETLLGSMPGYMKRVSISFYTRCLMFDAAQDYAIQAEKPSVYLPVSGAAAWSVLLGVTVVLTLAGMMIFARAEYQDLS